MENKSDKSEKKDYVVRLNKARKKRNKNDYERYLILAAIAIVVVVIIIFAGKAIAKRVSAGAEKTAATEETGSQGEESDQLTIDAKEAEESEAEAQAKKTEEEKKAVVDSYQNLGLVQVISECEKRTEHIGGHRGQADGRQCLRNFRQYPGGMVQDLLRRYRRIH